MYLISHDIKNAHDSAQQPCEFLYTSLYTTRWGELRFHGIELRLGSFIVGRSHYPYQMQSIMIYDVYRNSGSEKGANRLLRMLSRAGLSNPKDFTYRIFTSFLLRSPMYFSNSLGRTSALLFPEPIGPAAG